MYRKIQNKQYKEVKQKKLYRVNKFGNGKIEEVNKKKYNKSCKKEKI